MVEHLSAEAAWNETLTSRIDPGTVWYQHDSAQPLATKVGLFDEVFWTSR